MADCCENLIREVDIELRKLVLPVSSSDVEEFVKKAIDIASPLEGLVTTKHTQLYYRTRTEEPNCNSFWTLFNLHDSIAQRCHSCYKVQIKVSSLIELIVLSFLMKTLDLDNTRKCLIDTRTHAKGLYKGLIYCESMSEAESVSRQAEDHISKKSDMRPIFSIKRGCTEFANAHKKYSEGAEQPEAWRINEQRFLNGKDATTTAKLRGEGFNLYELLILKNWING